MLRNIFYSVTEMTDWKIKLVATLEQNWEPPDSTAVCNAYKDIAFLKLLYLLYFLDTHVSGINMSTFRSLRLYCW